MSSINKTTHYNLSQFGDNANDKPSWRGDYTSDMSKIDAQMFRNATDATTAASNANEAKAKADANGGILNALGAGDTTAASASKNKWNTASDNASYAKSKADANGTEINNIKSAYATNNYVDSTFLKHVNIAVAKLSNSNFSINEDSTTPQSITFGEHDGRTSFDDAEQVIKLSADKTNLTVSQSGVYIVSAAARFGGMSFADDNKYRGLELLMYINNEFLATAVATVVVGGNGSLRGAQYAAMPARPYKLNANDKISLKYRLNAATSATSGQINYAMLSTFRVSK